MIHPRKLNFRSAALFFLLLIPVSQVAGQADMTAADKAKAKQFMQNNPEAAAQIMADPALQKRLRDDPDLARRIEQNPDLIKTLKTDPVAGEGEKTADPAGTEFKEIEFEPEKAEGTDLELAEGKEDADENAVEDDEKKEELDRKGKYIAAEATIDKIHGRSLFTGGYKSFTSTDVPEDYILVEGDQIQLRLWGRYNLEKIYTIGKDGYVFIDPLNKQTYIKGMAHRRVKEMIRKIIDDMAGVEGDIKVISTHPISINVSGGAKTPGTILVPPYFTFWQALMISGGPSTWGSIRDIRLMRGSNTVHKLDIYEYLKTGKLPELGLQENDLILYGKMENIVEIKGIVRQTGIFELKTSETLEDLVDHAGGFISTEFSPYIHVERIIPVDKRTADGPTKEVLDIQLTGKEWKSFSLKDGDILFEKEKNTLIGNFVTIKGKGINVPGQYALTASENTLWHIIRKAGGLVEGFSENFEIVRTDPKGNHSFQLSIKTEEETRNFPLVSGDSILTYHSSNFEDVATITVHGFVRDSVRFIFSDSLTLTNVIQRAGGLRDGALPYVFIKKIDANDNIQYVKVPVAEADGYRMQKRDEVYAFRHLDFNKQFPVVVLAEDRGQMTLAYADDLSLNVIIHRLDGLHISTDSSKVEINTPDFTSEEVFIRSRLVPLDENTLYDTSLIQPGALIIFRKDAKKKEPEFVYFSGEFINPGSYAIRSKKETIASLLELAGGISGRANPYSIHIIRRGVDEQIPIPLKSADPLRFEGQWLLTSGDSIFVARNNNTIEVVGSVFNPGFVSFNRDYSWKDYVNNGAGGALDTADIKKTYIEYPNGNTFKAKKGWFSASAVVPGSRVVVPMKPYIEPQKQEPWDSKEFFQGVSTTLGAITSLVTIIVLTQQLK